MRINNLHVAGLAVGAAKPLLENDLPRTEGAQPAPSDVKLHVPSTELTRWVAQATLEPEIRPAVVERVSQMVVGGEYLTPDAALRTAQAILLAQE